MKVSRLGAGVVLAALGLTSTAGCGEGDRPPPPPPRHDNVARWQDVFDSVPDFYAVVRPQAIKKDPVYGPLWKSVLRMAQAQRFAGGPSSLEAAEGCDEVIVGIGRGEDAAMIFRGVPASLDPQRMMDASGHATFRLLTDKAKVPEYLPLARANGDPGSLFVLPDRTWVGATGQARDRARIAFQTPMNRPVPKVDGQALAFVRFSTDIVQGPRMKRSPLWGPLTKKLNSVTFALRPGKEGVFITALYEDDDASAWSEMHVKQILEGLRTGGANEATPPAPRPGEPRPDPGVGRPRGKIEWLKDAQVGRDGNNVIVKMPIPPRLLEELPNASGADIPL